MTEKTFKSSDIYIGNKKQLFEWTMTVVYSGQFALSREINPRNIYIMKQTERVERILATLGAPTTRFQLLILRKRYRKSCRASRAKGLQLNAKKMECMTISKRSEIPTCNISCNISCKGENKNVNAFKYFEVTTQMQSVTQK